MSAVSLTKTHWHSFDAWRLENEAAGLIVVPETGGKIVSLFDKACRYEWLVAPEQSHPFRKLAYGTDYNFNHPGGWDEMFPTIIAGTYPASGNLQGALLPDHGEVWTLPWMDAGTGRNCIRLTVDGEVLPYRLTRALSFTGTHELLLEYELHNQASEPLYYLWAAHPQFACEPGATIALPPEVKEVINVLPLEFGEEWGPPGTRNLWPTTSSVSREMLRQDIVTSPTRKGGRKFYLPPECPISWAGLQQPVSNSWLRMEWDAETLPYCGVWIDEGYLNTISAVAIEPTTGYYDDLTVAWNSHRVGLLEAGARRTWQLIVHLGRNRWA